MRFNLKSQILYQDNHLIVINKLPSQIVQGDKTGDEPLSEKVKSYIKVKYNKSGNVFLGVVHRLDRPVSGAVIFAKTSKALTRLNQMLQNKKITKKYWAIVKNPTPSQTGHLIHYIYRDTKKNKSHIFSKEKKGTKKAELIYTHISSSQNYRMLEIELLTGRHHQIRAQLAFIGCPVKGDVKYGFPRTNQNASIHLHSRTLEFIHPVKKEKIFIEANPPVDPLWDYFYSAGADRSMY